MKSLITLVATSVLFFAGVAEANPYRTLARDMQGTTFIITVDWENELVSADLRRNPANLDDAAIERKLQLAVSFGSSVTCGMKSEGRKAISPSKVQGKLDCSWFDRPIVNPSGAWPNENPTS